MAATAKRSATAIHRLARCLDDLSVEEKNTLMEAEEILMKHGNRAKNKATGEKRAEQIRERAQAKARAEAQQIIKTWPQTATLDRIALIHATRDGAERLSRRADERDPRWELNYATGEAINDIVSDAVMYAVPYSASTAAVPVSDQMARVRDMADKILVRPSMVALADKWDGRIAAQ